MPRLSEQQDIRDFILRMIPAHPHDISRVTLQEFNVTRVTVNNYLRELINQGLVLAKGNTRARVYELVLLTDVLFEIEIERGVSESAVWDFRVRPKLEGLPANILGLCEYGFTEILNNAIDHSASPTALISVKRTYHEITMTVRDMGVGIFEKIQRDRKLESPQAALLELSKGKLTSDPERHAGEGIYFTSRMFDDFSISSGELFYHRVRERDDGWLVDSKDSDSYLKGTYVFMKVRTNATWSTRDIFNRYQDDDLRFRRTHVPITLAREPGQQLVSRSQAKRILARFEQFTEVLLDFQGVEEIGQGFADEIFRIFPNRHPEIPLIAINTAPEVKRMIEFVKANAPLRAEGN